MMRSSNRSSFALSAVLGIGLIASGTLACTDSQEALIVSNANLLSEDAPCTSTDTMLAGDVVDLSFFTGYVANFTLLNNLTRSGTDGSNSGVESSEMKITDAIVELQDPYDTGALAGVTNNPWSAAIATNSFSGGDTIDTFIDVPGERLAELAAAVPAGESREILLSVRFRALRASNSGIGDSGVVESRSFEFPLTVCNGCLRATLYTEWTDPETDEVVNLCTDAYAASPIMGGGGRCGRAQSAAVYPACCSGVAADEPAGCFPD